LVQGRDDLHYVVNVVANVFVLRNAWKLCKYMRKYWLVMECCTCWSLFSQLHLFLLVIYPSYASSLYELRNGKEPVVCVSDFVCLC
jgi:hypothetical protein